MRTYRAWADRKMAEAEQRFAGPVNGYPLHGRPDETGGQGCFHPTVQTSRTGKRPGTARLATGVALVIAAGVLWWVPGIFSSLSMSQAHSICSSSVGALAQALSADARTGCGHVGTATLAVALVALAGAGLAVWGAMLRRRG